jgi:DMSO/TMAO reductase YedYZ molybdopterin-dependent catalytic subunit
LLTFTYDGQQLPEKYGYPMKLRMPTKLGYKNPQHIMEIFVTNTFPGGYWVDQGYNWFGVSDPSNPTLPHSRRSRMLRPVLSETERTCKRDWNSGHPT